MREITEQSIGKRMSCSFHRSLWSWFDVNFRTNFVSAGYRNCPQTFLRLVLLAGAAFWCPSIDRRNKRKSTDLWSNQWAHKERQWSHKSFRLAVGSCLSASVKSEISFNPKPPAWALSGREKSEINKSQAKEFRVVVRAGLKRFRCH